MSQMIFRVHANSEADVDELNILLSQGWVVNRTVQWPSFEWTDKVFEKHICEPCVDYILEMKQETVDSENIRVKPDEQPKAVGFDIVLIDGVMRHNSVRAVLRFDDGSTEWNYFDSIPDACDLVRKHGLDPGLLKVKP